jgi:protease I
MKALVISANGFEDLELYYPIYRLKEEGWDVTLSAPATGTISGKHGYEAKVDVQLSQVNPREYDLLIIPGGKAPEEVRLDGSALGIVRHFFDQNKPVAAICHGPQVLVSAGVIKGRNVTCWKGVKDDVVAAGAGYSDASVVVDWNLITSRMPDDLPEFMREVLNLIAGTLGVKVERAA